MNANTPEDLQRIYELRFRHNADYRRRIWRALIDGFFQKYADGAQAILDLGCGYGEFITQVHCPVKYAMDLNPDAPQRVGAEVKCLVQDCSTAWALPDTSLDLVFTSNFLEHLPDKAALGRTLDEASRCLKPGGRIVALGPNIKYLPGAYWDFWDHHLPLTELSLREAMESRELIVETCLDRFLPYTMASGRQYPIPLIRLYLRLPMAWRLFGKQFLIVARK